MQYTETELSNLILSVEKEFSAHLAKSEFPEEKPEMKEEHEEKEEPKEEGKEESKDEGHEEASEEEGKEEPKDEEHSEEGEEKAPEEGEESEGEEKPESDEGHDYDDEDMEQMHSLYSSMGKGELKAHHDCIKKCLDAHKEGPAMMKSEVTEAIVIPEVKNEEVSLLKSEFAAEKAKSELLQKSLDTVTELLTKMVKKSVPSAKAVTSLEVINKSEFNAQEKTLSKSEITAKLSAVASRPDLAKSDREAINAFYLGTNPNLESISHLLK